MADDLHLHSAVSTPYVSAPSTPASAPPHSYAAGFFYSAPASPTHHHTLSSSNSLLSSPLQGAGGSFEFEFTVRQEATGQAPAGSMTSADELFFNGQIRPMKLSSHLQRPQDLAPLIHVLDNDGENQQDVFGRGRDLRSKPLRRRTRSMSPLRSNTAFQWLEEFKDARESTEIKEKLEAEERQRADDDDNETPSSGASSRSSSAGRSSKRWVFLKELLYRSKSEGGNNRNHRLWSTLSFSPAAAQKEKKSSISKTADAVEGSGRTTPKKAVNGLGKGRSAHEVHYTRKRAQAEEMRKKTYLPYRQGVFGCLGFSSMNGFARALNSVSSR